MKKLLCVLLACVMLLGVLSACAKTPAAAEDTAPAAEAPAQTNDTPAEESTEQPAEESSALSGSITLMASQNWIKDIDQELFKEFEAQTGVEVKVLVTPDNGYETLLGTTLAGGSNTIDIFMYYGGNMMKAAGIPELALDLSGEEWAGRLEPWAVEANSVDGKLIGFSTWGVDYEGILYNKTMFEENGWTVPTTWDEFLALCDTIQAAGITPLYEGINGVWHTQGWFYDLTPSILAEKPDAVDYLNAGKENNWADIQAVHDGLEQIRELLNHEPRYFTNDGQSEDWFGSYTALQNRECAMMNTYSAYAAELAANGSTDEWGMFPAPMLDNTVAVSNGGGVSKYINKNSQNIEACKALLNFLAEPENLETYYAARTDLVTSAFTGVESVSATTATTDVLANSTDTAPVMLMKDVLYWDPDMYVYMQGFAEGSTTADDYIAAIDAYRANMFDIAAE